MDLELNLTSPIIVSNQPECERMLCLIGVVVNWLLGCPKAVRIYLDECQCTRQLEVPTGEVIWLPRDVTAHELAGYH